MTDNEILTGVKNGLGITGTYQDQTLNIYIDEVKSFIIEAGVKADFVLSIAGRAGFWNRAQIKQD